VPTAFGTVMLGVLEIDGQLAMVRTLIFGELHAFITIHQGHWICVLAPSAARPKVVSVETRGSGGWQRPKDAGSPVN
jgi:hypothetical protein